MTNEYVVIHDQDHLVHRVTFFYAHLARSRCGTPSVTYPKESEKERHRRLHSHGVMLHRKPQCANEVKRQNTPSISARPCAGCTANAVAGQQPTNELSGRAQSAAKPTRLVVR